MGIQKNCLFCGKHIYTTPHEIKRGWGKYCSHSCIMKDRHKKIPKSGEKNPHWKNTNIECKGCGEKFHIFKCHLSFKRYCSAKCRSKYATSPLRTRLQVEPRYAKWRSDVFRRDGWVCRTCNKKGVLNAHHIKSFKDIVIENKIETIQQALDCKILWDVDNGITLCIDCHKLTKNYGRKHE